MSRTAVVLFNLGGPDSLEAVRPFLYNLFSDPAIIRLPSPFRQMLALLIATFRAKKARAIYAELGGASPILSQTEAQAKALEKALGSEYKVFVCMRYWYPRADVVARQVKEYAPDRSVLLPLYPQYSTTTTASSFKDWERVARRTDLKTPTHRVESYPAEAQFIAAHVELLRAAYHPQARVLFSAHGLPEKIVAEGDPYPKQVEQSVRAIVQAFDIPNLDYVLCYQSRVGPLAWLKPSTDEEIRRAGREEKAVVVVPVAFVSEHSETLVELDKDYATLARERGVSDYRRVPALGVHPQFIACLAALCRKGA